MDFTVEKLKCGDKVHFKYVNKTNHYINGVVKLCFYSISL